MADQETLQALIGTTTQVSTVRVEHGPVKFFADTVFDSSPEYQSEAAAHEAGFPAVPAPPTFPIAIESWGRFVDFQDDDTETGPGMMAALAPLMAKGGLILHGEQSFTYHRPVYVGDVLKGVGVIADAYSKESKGKTMTFVVTETTWSDAKTGEPVVTSRFNIIHRI
jgi:acyl dehydratase